MNKIDVAVMTPLPEKPPHKNLLKSVFANWRRSLKNPTGGKLDYYFQYEAKPTRFWESCVTKEIQQLHQPTKVLDWIRPREKMPSRFHVIADLRNILMEEVQYDYDFGLFLDSDILLGTRQPDWIFYVTDQIIPWLLEDSKEADIVGGLVKIPTLHTDEELRLLALQGKTAFQQGWSSRFGYGFGGFSRKGPGVQFTKDLLPDPCAFYRVEFVNTACMWMSRKVMLSRLQFWAEPHKRTPEEIAKLKKRYSKIGKRWMKKDELFELSEDHTFCKYAGREKGFKIYVDYRVATTHLRYWWNRIWKLI